MRPVDWLITQQVGEKYMPKSKEGRGFALEGTVSGYLAV
jgi:hypothetical protein